MLPHPAGPAAAASAYPAPRDYAAWRPPAASGSHRPGGSERPMPRQLNGPSEWAISEKDVNDVFTIVECVKRTARPPLPARRHTPQRIKTAPAQSHIQYISPYGPSSPCSRPDWSVFFGLSRLPLEDRRRPRRFSFLLVDGGRVVERLGDGVALGIHAAQDLDPPSALCSMSCDWRSNPTPSSYRFSASSSPTSPSSSEWTISSSRFRPSSNESGH